MGKVKVTDNSRQFVEFKDLEDGEAFRSRGVPYIKTYNEEALNLIDWTITDEFEPWEEVEPIYAEIIIRG